MDNFKEKKKQKKEKFTVIIASLILRIFIVNKSKGAVFSPTTLAAAPLAKNYELLKIKKGR
ncbi:MAG: hypothetical protein U5N85_08195 [Arcicella sp.]|nr:hypothetical protein [Arcicella sp.]